VADLRASFEAKAAAAVWAAEFREYVPAAAAAKGTAAAT
jgi:hypothetical protein